MISEFKLQYKTLFEDALLEEILQVGLYKEIPEGELLIDIGQPITHMPLLIHGALKVTRENREGDELILYYIEQGDTCAVSLSCCTQQTRSSIRAIAEIKTKLIMLPVVNITTWFSLYPSWQNFVLNSYNQRLEELFDVIDTLAFMKLNKRLLKYLKDKVMINHDPIIQITHQQIAIDLHSSRVVISRLLKQLEIEGHILLQRNSIKLLSV